MKTLYVDLDSVLVDFRSGINQLTDQTIGQYNGRLDDVPGIFALMAPMPGAIEAYKRLSRKFDTYILSTAPWNNPSAWQHKVEWVKTHLGDVAKKRLILSHHKNLLKGHYLVDDRPNNGASEFEGEWIEFGKMPYLNWQVVEEYLNSRV